MYGRADRDVSERQRVAGLDRRIGTRHELRARGNTLRRDDVAPLAVGVAQERQKRAAIGIVLEALHLCGYPVLVALEVDLSVELLVPAALVAHRDLAIDVAPALLPLA